MGQNRIFPLFIFCLLALSQGAFAAGPAVGCTLSFDAAHTPLPGQPEDPLAVPDSASMIASCTDINSNQVICPAFDWTQTATGASITSSDHTPPSMNPSVTLSVPLGVAPEILKKVSATDSTQPLLTCYKNFNIGFAPSGPTCQLTPVRTYLDVSADPKNKLLGTTLYQIGSTYDKTPVKKGLIFQITMVSGQAASICYSTTNDVTGEASFTYDPQAQGCTNYRYIFCPQKMATDPGAGGIAARTQCLGDTGIDPNLPVSVCYGGTAIPNNYPAYLPAQNEFYFCNVVPNAPNMAALCWPLLLIFGLLTGASFAAGRNPFQAFDFSAPRMSRGRQYSMRNQQMSFDAMSGYYAADKASNNKLSETLSKKVVNPAMNTVGKGIKGAVKGVGSVFKTEAGKKLDKKEADLKKKQQEEINKNMPKAMPGDNKNIDLNKKKSSFDLVETTPDGRKVASNAGNSVMMAYNWAAGKELKNKTTKFMVNGKEITVKGQLTPKQVLQIQELSEKGRGKIIKEQFSGENLKDRLLKGGLGGLLSLAAMGGLNWLPGMRSAFMTTGWGAKMLAGTFYVVNTDRLPWGLNLLAPSIDAVKTDALKQWLEWTSKVTPDDRLENGYLSKDKTGVLFTTIKDGKEIYVYYDVKSNTTREATDADKKNFDLSKPPQYLQIGVNDGRVNIIQLSSSDYYSRMGDQGKQNEYVAKMIEYQLENSWTKGNLTLYKEKSNEVTQLLIYSRAQQDASEFYLQSKGDPKDGDAMKLLQLKVDVSRAAYETTATSTNSVQNGLWVEKYYDKAEDMTKLQLNKKLTETEKTVGTYKTLLEDTTEKIQKKNQEIEQKKVNGIDVTKDLNELKDLVGKQYELQKTYDERKVELNIYKEVQYGGMSTPDRETMKTTAKDDLKKTNDIIEKIYAGTATDDEKKQYSDLNEKKTQLERIVEDYERIDFKRDYENLSGKEQGKALKTEEKLQTKYTLEMNRIDSDIAKLDEKVNSNTATEDDKAQLTNLKASRETTFANLNSTNLKVSTYSAVNEGFDRNDELLLKYTQQVTDVRISRSISSTYSELTNIVGSFNVTPKEQVELTAYAQTKIQTGNERDLSTLENNIKYINNITGTLPMADYIKAFESQGDKTGALNIKTQILDANTSFIHTVISDDPNAKKIYLMQMKNLEEIKFEMDKETDLFSKGTVLNTMLNKPGAQYNAYENETVKSLNDLNRKIESKENRAIEIDKTIGELDKKISNLPDIPEDDRTPEQNRAYQKLTEEKNGLIEERKTLQTEAYDIENQKKPLQKKVDDLYYQTLDTYLENTVARTEYWAGQFHKWNPENKYPWSKEIGDPDVYLTSLKETIKEMKAFSKEVHGLLTSGDDKTKEQVKNITDNAFGLFRNTEQEVYYNSEKNRDDVRLSLHDQFKSPMYLDNPDDAVDNQLYGQTGANAQTRFIRQQMIDKKNMEDIQQMREALEQLKPETSQQKLIRKGKI